MPYDDVSHVRKRLKKAKPVPGLGAIKGQLSGQVQGSPKRIRPRTDVRVTSIRG